MNSLIATHQPIEQTFATDEPTLLHEFFERQVNLRPQKIAVECNGEVMTYAQLDQLANGIAACLTMQGVRSGSLVALYARKSCRLFAALLGVLKAGAGYVPLDPKFPIGRIQSIIEDAGIAIVISEGELGAELQEQVTSSVLFLEEAQIETSPSIQPALISPADVCYVIYTSGSTGRPKGVVIEHRNAINFVRALQSVYQLDARDRVYQGFSIAFDASVEEIWAAFSLGGTLVVPNEEIARSTIDAAEFINARKVSFFSTVPSFLSLMQSEFPRVRLLVLGGEACAPELVARWAKPGRRMLNTYGPTEATVVATWAECLPSKPVTIGKALPGYATLVLDDRLQPVPPGTTGELYIGGESVARGYLNRPDLTAERFVQNPGGETGSRPGRVYRTCDLVRLTADGDLQFVGRADGQIKIRGFRVELSEIEAVLMEHPSIRAAAVNAYEFDGMKELAAYVVRQPSVDRVDHSSIAALLQSRLPEYMCPKYLDVIDELPTMTSGKIDRKLLPPPCNLFTSSARKIVGPATELERLLVEVWQKVFGISPISVEDDFFVDLRGHSLNAGKVVTEIRLNLKTVQGAVRDIYEHRTIRRLALHWASAVAETRSDHPGPQANPEKAAKSNLEHPTLPRTRWLFVALQMIALIAFYAVASAPAVFAIVLTLKFINRELSSEELATMATVVTFLIWPSWLLLSLAVKWIVIGRFKPGRYPVWGLYYFRWWLVNLFQTLSWSGMLVGTPLMSLYYRAMGAKVGRNCTINTAHCAAFDLVTIGENSSIEADTQLLGYRVENGWLVLGYVAIGRDCYVGTHCALGLNVTMQQGARLGEMSLLPDNSVIAAHSGLCGSPPRIADDELPKVQPRRTRLQAARTIWFSVLHLGLIYVMGWFLILAALPGLAFTGYALYSHGPLWAAVAAFVAVPVSIIWYLALVVFVKRKVIGRIRPGIYSIYSCAYLRYWFLNYLLNNTRYLVQPIYATLFFPRFLRLLGAKVGRGVEVSTVMHVMPDLLEIGDGSFLADACIVGAHRLHRGFVELRPVKIGKRTFIGNSALVPAGADIGDNSLIGVMSVPPAGMTRTPDQSRWFGSPSFELLHTEKVCFSEDQTYEPSVVLIYLRAFTEMFRILLPGFAAVAGLLLFVVAIVTSYYTLPVPALLLVAPCATLIVSFLSIAFVSWIKNLLIGRYDPTVRPLWCFYVWLNEIVNALYETVAAPAMGPLVGTPFIAPCLRMMGCKIGKWVFMETTLLSEFDLIEIGDRVAINLGCTLQTHLFEDRVMKSDRLRIGDRCSLGNMSVVLYSAEMQPGSTLGPLSVLMKGEVLPPASRWSGIPTQPAESSLAVPGQSARSGVALRLDTALKFAQNL